LIDLDLENALRAKYIAGTNTTHKTTAKAVIKPIFPPCDISSLVDFFDDGGVRNGSFILYIIL